MGTEKSIAQGLRDLDLKLTLNGHVGPPPASAVMGKGTVSNEDGCEQ